MYTDLLLREEHTVGNDLLLDKLKSYDQSMYLKLTLRSLEKKYLPDHPKKDQIARRNSMIDGAAALIKTIIQNRDSMKSSLHEWLVNGLESEIKGIDLRRAAIASVSADDVLDLFFKSLEAFGDPLSIKHTPLTKQDANLQVLLLLSGNLYRKSTFELRNALMFGSYLTTVSNRMAASSPHSRLLGMFLGTILSRLVDDPSNILAFELEDAEREELALYEGLTQVEDHVGSLQDLVVSIEQRSDHKANGRSSFLGERVAAKNVQKSDNSPKISAAEAPPDNGNGDDDTELHSDSDSDFISHEKPDSDAEDSDEDPTVVDRSKPRAPMYVSGYHHFLGDPLLTSRQLYTRATSIPP